MITLRDAISGDGFLAAITLSGRALMREEEGQWWLYGVRPAGLAASGSSVEAAFLHFRNTYKEALFDIAQQCANFDDFKKEVERFFFEDDGDDQDARLWESALAAIRAGQLDPPGPFAKLPRESPESKPSQITVERLDVSGKRFVPSDNVTDVYSIPQAFKAA